MDLDESVSVSDDQAMVVALDNIVARRMSHHVEAESFLRGFGRSSGGCAQAHGKKHETDEGTCELELPGHRDSFESRNRQAPSTNHTMTTVRSVPCRTDATR